MQPKGEKISPPPPSSLRRRRSGSPLPPAPSVERLTPDREKGFRVLYLVCEPRSVHTLLLLLCICVSVVCVCSGSEQVFLCVKRGSDIEFGNKKSRSGEKIKKLSKKFSR